MSSTDAAAGLQSAAAQMRFCAGCLAEPTAEALVALTEAVNEQPWLAEPLAELEATALEVWQGEHTRLFVAPALAPPFACAHREGILNGAAASAAVAYYAQHGLELSSGLPGDYLGSLLEFDAWLLDTGQVPEAGAFWQAFLVDWLGRFNEQLQQHARLLFYRRLGERLVGLNEALAQLQAEQPAVTAH